MDKLIGNLGIIWNCGEHIIVLPIIIRWNIIVSIFSITKSPCLPSSKHGKWAMFINPILEIITMGILNPIDGCVIIPLYEETNHVLCCHNSMLSPAKKYA